MLPIAISAGIDYNTFWDMTFGEILPCVENYQKEQIRMEYNLATMVAQFVGLTLNGKRLPRIEDCFPSSFEIDEQTQYQREMMIKEQLLDFAKSHNANRHKEGE